MAPAVRAELQLRGLVYLLYPLATLGVPYLFRLAAPGEARREWCWRAYSAAALPPALFLAGAGWIAWGASGAVPWREAALPGAALLLFWSLVLASASDLARLASAGAGQFLPVLAGLGLMLSVFAGSRWLERAPSEETRAARIDLVVRTNPLLAACERLPGHDPLRTERVYMRTYAGADHVYRLPPWRQTLAGYAVAALALATFATLARAGLRAWGPWQPGVPPARPAQGARTH